MVVQWSSSLPDTAAIRAAFDEGELSAAVEPRRRFQGVTDMAGARAIADWAPIALPSPSAP
jgi:hypothetical protein